MQNTSTPPITSISTHRNNASSKENRDDAKNSTFSERLFNRTRITGAVGWKLARNPLLTNQIAAKI
jgi:hypothetical protein